MEYISQSEEETKKIAQNLAIKLKDSGGVVGLTGDLGAGKTTFAQGFAKGLGIEERILSPTFILMRQYKIPGSNKVFYHLDLYRLENSSEIEQLGLMEILENQENIVLIEWAEKIYNLLSANSIKVKINKKSLSERTILITQFNSPEEKA